MVLSLDNLLVDDGKSWPTNQQTCGIHSSLCVAETDLTRWESSWHLQCKDRQHPSTVLQSLPQSIEVRHPYGKCPFGACSNELFCTAGSLRPGQLSVRQELGSKDWGEGWHWHGKGVFGGGSRRVCSQGVDWGRTVGRAQGKGSRQGLNAGQGRTPGQIRGNSNQSRT